MSLDNGIRPGEAFQLLINDFHFTSMDVYIRPEVDKTNRGRTIPISIPTAKAIKQLIASRDESWNENAPVFCTYEGKYLNRNIWGDRLESYSEKMDEHITPYSLRHCFAIQYLRNGGDVLRLQKIMGHSDLAMTKIYCNITNADIHEQHNEVSPIVNMIYPPRSRVTRI
ncbi:MAG TPA: site-specific integrase [Syntrophomonas sp.]|nr:site-specific integrase [Syntrophomonas sp.]